MYAITGINGKVGGAGVLAAASLSSTALSAAAEHTHSSVSPTSRLEVAGRASRCLPKT
jgi:hypothetical protein